MPTTADRVFETTITQGTGELSLLGAQNGFRAFRDAFADGATVFYLIDQVSTAWEVGIGTLTEASPDRLSRDTIITSSTGGGAVNFGGGTKNVLCVEPAAVLNGVPAGFSGTSRPIWVRGGGSWVDTTTTPWIVKFFDGTNDIPIWQIDPAGNLATPYFGAAPLTRFSRNHIDGLILTAAADAAHDITMGEGEVRDLLNTKDLVLSTPITKRIDAFWAKGTGNGGLFEAGGSPPVAANTWYAELVMQEDATGDLDWGFDTDAGGANVPSGWTVVRRAGIRRTDASANLYDTVQNGDDVLLKDPVLINNQSVGTTASLITAGMSGVKTKVRTTIQRTDGGNLATLVSSPDQNDTAPSFTGTATHGHTAADAGAGVENNRIMDTYDVWTNDSGQIRARQSGAANLRMNLLGWKDLRGKE